MPTASVDQELVSAPWEAQDAGRGDARPDDSGDARSCSRLRRENRQLRLQREIRHGRVRPGSRSGDGRECSPEGFRHVE